MEMQIRETGEQEQPMEQKPKYKFHHKPWVRATALILAGTMIFSIWANSAIKVDIQRGDEMDAATNYLVDNTDYVHEDEWGRFQDKLEAYQKATQLEDYYHLAGTQIAEEKYSEALSSINQCINLYPGGDEALHLDLLLKRACLLVLLVRQDEALTALDQVLEIQPNHTDACLIKAQIYAERNQLEPLTEVLAVYLSQMPEEYNIRLVYAQALFELQRFEEAAGEYTLLLESESEQVQKSEIWYLLGLTQLQLSDYAASEKALQQAKQGNPDLEGLDYYIGICQMSREGYAEAVASFTASIEKNGMLQHSHYSRGVCRIMLDSADEGALDDLRFAADYTGADADKNIKQQSGDLLAQLQGVIDLPAEG